MLRTSLLLVCLFSTLPALGREANIDVDGRPYFVMAADFNRDGYTDLAVSGATYFGDAVPYDDAFFLSLYEADGHGSFSLRARINTRSLIDSFSIGDIDNDGFEDLVTPREVFFDPGVVGFANRQPVPLPPDVRVPYRVATGDFNGDGRDDFAVADLEQRSISFFTYDNGLRWMTSVPVSHNPNTLIAVDVDADGISDIVTGAPKGTVSVLHMSPAFRFREVQTAPAGTFLQDIAAMSLHGNSFTDIVALDQLGSAFVYSIGPDALTLIHELRGTGRTLTVIADDVTGDGLCDVVIGQSDGFLFVFEFDERGNVKRSFAIRPVSYAFQLSTADLDGDGFQDVLIADASSSHLTLLYGPLSPPPTRHRGIRQ